MDCTIWNWNIQFLNDMPPDKVKNWIITKTSTHLKVVCNRVTVLNFNFAVDCNSNKRDGEKVWSSKAKRFQFHYFNSTSIVPLVRNLSC